MKGTSASRCYPPEQTVHQRSGWIGTQGQALREPGDTSKHTVIQAVTGFPTAQAATDFAAQQQGSWTRCIGKSITATYTKGGPETFSINTVTNQNGILTALLTQEGGDGWGCQHVLTTHNNVVVDVSACAMAPGDQATTIATGITGRAT